MAVRLVAPPTDPRGGHEDDDASGEHQPPDHYPPMSPARRCYRDGGNGTCSNVGIARSVNAVRGDWRPRSHSIIVGHSMSLPGTERDVIAQGAAKPPNADAPQMD